MSDDRILSKGARRLIPFMGLLYLVNVIDRTNAGFAALTMNKDLGFSPTVFGFGAGIFFVGYALFQVPANLILERTGANPDGFLHRAFSPGCGGGRVWSRHAALSDLLVSKGASCTPHRLFH